MLKVIEKFGHLSKNINLPLINTKISKENQLISINQNSFTLKSHQSYYFSNKKDDFKKKMTKQQMFKAQQQQLMNQKPDEDPTTYDRASGYGGKIFMAFGVLVIFGVVAYVENKNNNIQSQIDQNITGMVTLKEQKKKIIGGQWSLIDHNNKPFSSTDLAGSYYLIYFGFTKCPDICPITLIKLSKVLRLIRKMPENNYLNLKMVFVSCDPERDTPKRMKQYLKNFDDQIIGITASSKDDIQLINCMKSYKIYANRIPLQNGNYSIDHTTITYLMDQSNEYVDHLNPNLTEQEMAKAIVNKILQNDYKKIQKRKSKSNQ